MAINIKEVVSNAIVKHLIKFKEKILNNFYTKTEIDDNINNITSSLSSGYLTKEKANVLIRENFPTTTLKNITPNTLFNGVANSTGSYTLSDSVDNYNFLIVYSKLYKKSNSNVKGYGSSTLINVSDINFVPSSSEAQYRISISDSNGYYADFSFINKNTLYVKTLYANGNTSYIMYLYKVEGFKII